MLLQFSFIWTRSAYPSINTIILLRQNEVPHPPSLPQQVLQPAPSTPGCCGKEERDTGLEKGTQTLLAWFRNWVQVCYQNISHH